MLGHKDILGLLIENGACVSQKNKEGFSARHFAVLKGDLEITR